MTPISVAEIRYRHGFTLLELLLVLGIVAMMASLIGPGLNSLDSPGFNAQIREASALLNYARRRAVVEGQTLTIEFVPMNVTDVPDSDSRGVVAGRWHSSDIELWFAPTAQSSRRQDSLLQVAFFPEGGSTGGELTFYQGERQRVLMVDPFSGRVSAQHEN